MFHYINAKPNKMNSVSQRPLREDDPFSRPCGNSHDALVLGREEEPS